MSEAQPSGYEGPDAPRLGQRRGPDARKGNPLRAGEIVAGAAGVALLAAAARRRSLTGVCALPALALPALQAATRSPALPVAAGVATAVAGMVAVPAAARAGDWPRLLAAAGVLAGGWLSIRDEHVPGSNPPIVPKRPAPPA